MSPWPDLKEPGMLAKASRAPAFDLLKAASTPGPAILNGVLQLAFKGVAGGVLIPPEAAWCDRGLIVGRD